MATFAELYCAKTGCAPQEFRQRIFWRTLHRHAVLLAPLLLVSDYFDSDRSLIDACAGATRMRQINEEIRNHPVYPRHGQWLHRHANLRISTRRLHHLAAQYLARPKSAA